MLRAGGRRNGGARRGGDFRLGALDFGFDPGKVGLAMEFDGLVQLLYTYCSDDVGGGEPRGRLVHRMEVGKTV